MIYHSPSLRFEADRLVDELGTLEVGALPDPPMPVDLRLRDPTPFMERLWRCAISDVRGNQCQRAEGRYFAAGGRGGGWNGMVFTRDQGYAGILGLNRLFPAEMREAMATTLAVRLGLGLAVDRDEYIEGLPFLRHDISHADFLRTHGTNSFVRRTDDVLWLWWADDLFSEHYDTPADWAWVLATGRRCFTELYDPFYDAGTGLYRGQSSFVDIGFNGYPESFGALRSLEAKRNCLLSRATSTNGLYYKGLSVLAKAAAKIGETDEARSWQERADRLRRAIRSRLIAPDGTPAYFMHPDGHLEQRQHTLATAFSVLHGVLTQEEARRAVEAFPLTWWGAPLIHPFYPNGQFYHNQSSWPFSDAFLLRARERVLGDDETGRELALLARSCRGDSFHEWIPANTKLPQGQPACLWTAAAFIGRCIQHGWVERRPAAAGHLCATT